MNNRRFDLLVFDWDGTLVDSTGHIVHCIRAACEDLDLPVPSKADASHVIGLGLQDALAYLLPGIEPTRHREVAERYRVHFLAGDETITPFPRVVDGLASLEQAGYLLAVATGKSRRGLDRTLAKLPFGSRFVATRCADEGFPKPHPDMLERLMTMLGAEAERTLMIGDTSHDLQMARNAGTPALAVAYGAHRSEDLMRHDPLDCLDSFEEVLKWLATNG